MLSYNYSFCNNNEFLHFKAHKKKINASFESSLIQTNRYLGALLQKAENINFAISTNSNLVELSNHYNNNERNYFDIYTLRENLLNDIMFQAETNAEIDSIYVYISNINALITSKFGQFNYDEVKQYNNLKEMESIRKAYKWTAPYIDDGLSKNEYISVISEAHQLRTKVKSPTYISVNYNEATLCDIINTLEITPNSKVFLTDENGTIISTENKSLLNTSISSIFNINTDKGKEYSLNKIKIDKEIFYSIYAKDTWKNWHIMLLIPEKELLNEFDVFKRIFIFFSILILPIVMYFSIQIIIRNVDKPVSSLVTLMRKVENGNFNVIIQENRKDEFGYLFKSCNNMVLKIGKLIENLYHQKILRQEIELKALKKQIDPHFLYDTLDTVNLIAKANKIEEISNIVVALSNMYRTTFNRGNDLIRCSDMIEGIRCYLAILKIRYGNSFDYFIDIDRESEECYLLNLLIQTLVENAVVHGIGECRESRCIRVSCEKCNPDVMICVEDNGEGMSEEKLELLNLSINNNNIQEDSGLKNVQKRVKLYYGEQYGLNITSKLNKGTKVTLIIPYVSKIESNIKKGDNCG